MARHQGTNMENHLWNRASPSKGFPSLGQLLHGPPKTTKFTPWKTNHFGRECVMQVMGDSTKSTGNVVNFTLPDHISSSFSCY